jgi:predicted branched-subunit amino acid permease
VQSETRLNQFWQGFRLGLPVSIVSAPFGMLFGVLAADNGFSVLEATVMSATVFAGASQMVGLELFGQRIAPGLIVFSIFAVNFRHILYSASVGRLVRHWTPLQRAVGFFFLTDPQYAESERRAETGGTVGFVWYMGIATPLYLFWIVEAALGAGFGSLLGNTQGLGLDFLLPIYFLGLVIGFRRRPLWLPVVLVSSAASILAYHTIGSPWHVSLGALAGVVLAVALPPSRSGIEAVAAEAAPAEAP